MTRALSRVLFLAYITIHHVFALSASGDEIIRKISTPAEFVEALTDTTVARILITVSEIVISDADFLKHGTIELQRNVSVQGDGALPDYPYLRLLAFKKVGRVTGVTVVPMSQHGSGSTRAQQQQRAGMQWPARL